MWRILPKLWANESISSKHASPYVITYSSVNITWFALLRHETSVQLSSVLFDLPPLWVTSKEFL